MNIALIFAGGTGQRMNSKAKPKQFLELYGKPILIHTMEYFEKHEEIDEICLVVLEDWLEEVESILKYFMIKKVKYLVKGGKTGHESIYLGLIEIGKKCRADDIILIHDGVRPLISKELISKNIKGVKEHGNAITVENASETIATITKDNKISRIPKRDLTKIAKAPQSFYYKDIMTAHKKAKEEGFLSIDSAHLMNRYKVELNVVESTPYNIKITTPSDYYVFRALYDARENSQVFGI